MAIKAEEAQAASNLLWQCIADLVGRLAANGMWNVMIVVEPEPLMAGCLLRIRQKGSSEWVERRLRTDLVAEMGQSDRLQLASAVLLDLRRTQIDVLAAG